MVGEKGIKTGMEGKAKPERFVAIVVIVSIGTVATPLFTGLFEGD